MYLLRAFIHGTKPYEDQNHQQFYEFPHILLPLWQLEHSLQLFAFLHGFLYLQKQKKIFSEASHCMCMCSFGLSEAKSHVTIPHSVHIIIISACRIHALETFFQINIRTNLPFPFHITLIVLPIMLLNSALCLQQLVICQLTE